MSEVIIKYQIMDEDGNNTLEPYMIKESAEYMSKTYFPNTFVLEIEEILREN